MSEDGAVYSTANQPELPVDPAVSARYVALTTELNQWLAAGRAIVRRHSYVVQSEHVEEHLKVIDGLPIGYKIDYSIGITPEEAFSFEFPAGHPSMKKSPSIQKADSVLATIHAEEQATSDATKKLRDGIVSRRDALLPLRDRLRKEIEAGGDEDVKEAYQECCAKISRMDSQIGVCDKLILPEPADADNR